MAYTPGPWLQGDIGQVIYFMELDGQTLMMVLHFRVKESGSANYLLDTQSIVDSLAAQLPVGGGFWNDVLTQQSNELNYTRIQVQRISPTRDIYVSTDLAETGATVGPAAPPNVALTLNKRTLLPGKKGHGTIHVPGLPAAQLDEGLWGATLTLNIIEAVDEDLVDEYDVGFAGLILEWGIPDLAPGGTNFNDIVQVNGKRTITTMHRRTVGLGI